MEINQANTNHSIGKFFFKDKAGNAIEVNSMPYTLNLEECVLKKRFGDQWRMLMQGGTLDLELDIKAVEEDFPKLLELQNCQIDWASQNYDEIARVYYFFLEYRLNAKQRALKLESDALRSQIAEMKNLLQTFPSDISQMITPGTS